jgi:hypothetical protein
LQLQKLTFASKRQVQKLTLQLQKLTFATAKADFCSPLLQVQEQRLVDAKTTYLVKLKAALKKDAVDVFKLTVSEIVKQKRDDAQAAAVHAALAKARSEAVPPAPAQAGTPSFIARMLG